MQRTLSKEIKSLIIFLAAVVLAAALIWLVLEAATSKPVKKVRSKAAASKNLASEKDGAEEKVPLVGENFEVFQFNDPFRPLSPSLAPEENKSLSGASSSSSGSGGNTAALVSNRPQVLKISIAGGKKTATVRINGKTANYSEGQSLARYKIIYISPTAKRVEFLKGDQKFAISVTKRK